MNLSNKLIAVYLAAFHTSAWGTAAFTLPSSPKESSVVLRSSSPTRQGIVTSGINPNPQTQPPRSPVIGNSAITRSTAAPTGDGQEFGLRKALPPRKFSGLEAYPKYESLRRIQGEGTVETYNMPPWAERCQLYLETNGRPLKAMVQMWVGPIRTTHTLTINSEDGSETPYQSTLKFKKGLAPVIRVSTTDPNNPIWAGVSVPSVQRNDELAEDYEKVWKNCPKEKKQKIQGGDTDGSSGANRYWNIPPHVESVQILGWSGEVGKKSFKVDIEVLQGPNSVRQNYSVQCGGSTQPYHAVVQTPGDGCAIRVRNKKFLEDGLVQFAVVPYEVQDDERAKYEGIVF